MEKEIWRDAKYIDSKGNVTDFSGYYQVSNFGKIKHLERIVIRNGIKYTYKERISDYTNKQPKSKYISIELRKDGLVLNGHLHRLLLSSFVPESNTYECINHKDFNGHNNTIVLNEDGTVNKELTNIEWCTSVYNNEYSEIQKLAVEANRKREYKKGFHLTKEWKERLSRSLKGKKWDEERKEAWSKQMTGVLNTNRSKRVIQYTKDGIYVSEYPSVREAVRKNKGFSYSTICSCCSGIKKSSNGYIWKYK